MSYSTAFRATSSASPNAPVTELADLLLSLLPVLREQMGREALVPYLDGCEELAVEPGTLLFGEGDEVDPVLLIVEGYVKEGRTHGAGDMQRRLKVRDAGSGVLLGLYDLVYRRPHTTVAVAQSHCLLIKIPPAQINRLLYRFNKLRGALLPEAAVNRLRTLPLLAGVDTVSLVYLAAALVERPARAGEVLYQAGDEAANLYLISRGQVLLEHEDGRKLWLGTGGDFGYGEGARAGSGRIYTLDHNATAVSGCDLLLVRRAQFYAITGIPVEEAGWALRIARIQTLEHLSFFAAWQPEPLKQLLGFMSHYLIPASHLVTQQGEPADSLWVLLPGAGALIHALDAAGDAEGETRIAGANLFNEEVLHAPALAAGTIEAEPGSQWLRLHWRDYELFLQQTGQGEHAARLHALRNPPPRRNTRDHRRFPWLDTGERVVLEVRRHWIDLPARIAPALLLTVVTFFLALGLAAASRGAEVSQLAPVSLRCLLLPTALAALLAWLWGVADYRNDYLVVTNQRVMHQDKMLFIKHFSAWTPLESVQDIAVKNGFWGLRLGYADVEVQTPGASRNISFSRASRASELKKAIHSERARRVQTHQSIGKREIHETLANRFGLALDLPARVWPGAAHATPLEASAGQGRRSRRRAAEASGAQPTTPQRLVWRQHWLILLRNTIGQITLLMILFAIALWIALGGGGTPRYSSFHSVLLFAAALVVLWILWSIDDWRIDEYILDKDQVVDKLATPLGLRNEQRVAQVSDLVEINFAQPTPVHIFFDFGSVFLQTAAAEGQFTFLNVPNPQYVTELIRKRRDEARAALEHKKALQRAEEFPDWLEIYARLQPGRLE